MERLQRKIQRIIPRTLSRTDLSSAMDLGGVEIVLGLDPSRPIKIPLNGGTKSVKVSASEAWDVASPITWSDGEELTATKTASGVTFEAEQNDWLDREATAVLSGATKSSEVGIFQRGTRTLLEFQSSVLEFQGGAILGFLKN